MIERKSTYNPEADKRWREKNREHYRYLKKRSTARSFIRIDSTLEDLDELEQMIAVRRQELIDKQ